MVDTVALPRDVLPAILAALQQRQRVLCDAVTSQPFDMARYGERDRNWQAIMAIRDALQDYSPAKETT